ncbi:MAG: hypothetical protein U9R75_05145, partial [Candidatus Thermoplasmatota archaeon]|nr:hypothetical protein [Candidatus Thermoplasmatota archaeon]
SGITVRTDDRSRSLLGELFKTMKREGILPTDERIPVEEVKVGKTKMIYIFHLPLGRTVTEPLARSLSYGIRKKLGAKADYFAVDNGFSITSPKKLRREMLIDAFGQERFLTTIKELVLGSSLFRTRFAHCLSKSLLVLTRFRGKDTSAIYRRSKTDKLLRRVTDSWYSESGWDAEKDAMSGLVLLAEESFKEVFNERIDLENCQKILNGLSSGNLDLQIIEDRGSPSVMGNNILGGLKGIHERYRKKEDLVSEGEEQSKISVETSIGCDTDIKGITNGSDGPSNKDIPLPSSTELESRGLGWIDAGGIVQLDIKRATIAQNRFDRLFQMGGPVNSMRKLPFAVHPFSALQRSGNGTYRDLRSAVKSGRLLPGRILSMDCFMDPKWKHVAELLSPSSDHLSILVDKINNTDAPLNRGDIGGALDLKGDDLTTAIQNMLDCNEISIFPNEVQFHLGAEEGYHVQQGHGTIEDIEMDEDVDRLISFLRRFGPFTIGEISAIFNWPKGHRPPAIESSYGLGRVKIEIGPKGLALGAEEYGEVENSLWIVPRESLYKKSGEKDPEREWPIMLPSSDPAVALISPDDNWIEDERVRGARNRKFSLTIANGSRIGFCHILETNDTIRIIQVEIEDYELIGLSAGSLLEAVECFERLGYEIFTVEGFLGIPAGEAADTAVEVLIRDKFTRWTVPKGSILVRGCSVKFHIKRERMLLEMMQRQGLLPGQNMKHPLEVILKLGSFTDRWEILSRLGSVRYDRIPVAIDEHVSRTIEATWNRLSEQLSKGNEPFLKDMGDMPSNGTERLSDQKDLTKRFSLRRGRMDQTSDVWSLTELFMKYPFPSPSEKRTPNDVERGIMKRIARGQKEEIGSYIRTHGLTGEAESILKQGTILEDAWGKYEYPFRDGRIGDEPLRSRVSVPRGLQQTLWLSMNCNNLGSFTIDDMINYSPELVDPSKMRRLLNGLVGKNIDRVLSPDLGMRVVYTVKGVDLNSEKGVDDLENELVVISPKDRMSKVVSPDIRIRLSKVSGFSIFRGQKAVALVSLKRMKNPFKNTGFGEQVKGSSHLENYIIKKAWVDLRFKRRELLREIKKAFFNLGYQLVTDDEKTKIESLYRDIEKKHP